MATTKKATTTKAITLKISKADIDRINKELEALSDPANLKSFDSAVCPPWAKSRGIIKLLTEAVPFPMWKAVLKALEAGLDAECKLS